MTFEKFVFAPGATRAGRIKLHRGGCGHVDHLDTDEMGTVMIPAEEVEECEFHFCPICTDLKPEGAKYSGY